MKIALVSYSAIFIVLLSAYLMTSVLILFSQALEVLSDVFVSIFLLLSISWSSKPADKAHMFGHGRAQYVAALVASTILILFMSIEVFREAVPKLFETQSDTEVETGLAIVVMLIAMAVLVVPIVDILRSKTRGPSVQAQLVQLAKDEVSYIPALVGVLFVSQGYLIADPIASVIIGAVIVIGGVYLFRENVHYLVGKAPPSEFLAKVESTARSVKGVLRVHDLAAEYVGPGKVHAGLHIEVARGTPIEEADRISHEVGERVGIETGCEQCIVHVDPEGG